VTLKALGYTNALNYGGGTDDWLFTTMADYMQNLDDLSPPLTRTWEDSIDGPGIGDGTIIVNNNVATRNGKWRVIGDPGEFMRDYDRDPNLPDLTDPHGQFATAIIIPEAFLHHNCLLSEDRGQVTWIPLIQVDGDYEVYVWLTNEVSIDPEIRTNQNQVIPPGDTKESTNIGEYRISFADGMLDYVKVEGGVTTPGWYRLVGDKAKEKTIGGLIYRYYPFKRYNSYGLKDPYLRKGGNGHVELYASMKNVYADAVMFYKIPE
jgi:hypothetical protein